MKTALLIIDMQNFFAPMTQQHALPQIPNLITHFTRHHFPLIFTQHGHPASDLKPPYPNQLVRKWGPNGSLHRGKPGNWELQPEIEEAFETARKEYEGGSGGSDDAASSSPRVDGGGELTRIDKNTYDAFIDTDLADVLTRWCGEGVVVCGVMTDCCVDTTARSAFNRGWETWVVRDACGSANKKQHEAGLRGFEFGFGELVSADEVVRRVK